MEEYGGRPARRHTAIQSQLDYRGAGPLLVHAVIEVGNQEVTRLEFSAPRKAAGYESDAVRIQVTVGRDCGGNDNGRNKLPTLVVRICECAAQR